MAYIDTLQKVTIPVRGEPVECIAGSFKGVPFFFESTDFSGGGRNVQTNSIPFSNDHVNEDTGITSRSIRSTSTLSARMPKTRKTTSYASVTRKVLANLFTRISAYSRPASTRQ